MPTSLSTRSFTMTDRQAGRQTDRETSKQAGKQTSRQTDRDKQASGQADRQTNRHRQTEINKQAGKQTDRQTGRQTSLTRKDTGERHHGALRGRFISHDYAILQPRLPCQNTSASRQRRSVPFKDLVGPIRVNALLAEVYCRWHSSKRLPLIPVGLFSQLFYFQMTVVVRQTSAGVLKSKRHQVVLIRVVVVCAVWNSLRMSRPLALTSGVVSCFLLLKLCRGMFLL